jgi:hypothetical protein
MSTITSTITSVSPACGALRSGEAAAQRRGLLQRFLDRMVEARMRKADEFIRQHRHLIPRELDEAGWKVTEYSEDSLPFVR